jgi:hypothetical protein
MANLNELQCLTTNGNTGSGQCFFDPKIIVGAFLCPKGFEVDVTTTLQATLIAATHNITKSARLYPVYDFISPKDNTEQKTIQTFNTGAKKVVREGYNDWEFQYVQGGVTLHKHLRKFNGSSYDFLFVDSENRIIGIQGSTASKLRAIPSDGGFFWANPWKANDGSKITEYGVQFVFHVKYLNDLVGFVKADFDVASTVYGLQDVALKVETAGVAGSYYVTPKTEIGTLLADLYPTALASITEWIASNTTTKAAITILSVALGTNAAGESCFKIACDTSDTDYPTGTDHISFNLVAPAVLQAAGIDGYESTGAVDMAIN